MAREVKPLGLVLKAGVWYLVAQVDGQIRSYRIANIVKLSATGERFERPTDFDLVRFWTTAARTYEDGLYCGTATLRVSPRGMTRWSLFPSAVAEAAAATVGAADADGWTTVTVPIESVDHAALEFLRLGTDAEVIEPAELRQCIANTISGLSRLYASDHG